MKGDLEEQNRPYPTYLRLRQQGKSREEREGENTWDIREVKWIAPLCLRQYAEIKFSSKHNLLLLSDGALQHLEKKNTPLICLCHNHPTELNLKDSMVITLWCDFNILKWFSWPIFIRVCTHTHTGLGAWLAPWYSRTRGLGLLWLISAISTILSCFFFTFYLIELAPRGNSPPWKMYYPVFSLGFYTKCTYSHL